MSITPEAICNKCWNPATMMCQRCHENYCSTDCQILDWKEHKSKCYQMPNLVPIGKVSSRLCNSKANKDFNDSYLSEPLTNETSHNRIYESNHRRNESGCAAKDTRVMSRNAHQSDHVKVATEQKPVVLLGDKDFALKPKLAPKEEQPDCSKGAIPKRFSAAEVAPWKSPFMPTEGKYFEAIIQCLEEDHQCNLIWVTERKYEEALNKLLIDINRTINKNTPCSVGEIQVGSLLAAPLDDIYYRVEVLDVNSSSRVANVRLIDYGNQLKVPYAELRSSTPIMRNLNAYAVRIQLSNGSSAKKNLNIEDILCIRVLSTKTGSGTFLAELKVATAPIALSLEMLSCKPEMSLRKVFNDGQHALLQFVSFKDFTAEMHEELTSAAKGSGLDFAANELPAEGSFVAARTSQGWRRATMLGHCEAIASYLVYLIDEGQVGMCKMLKKIPQAFIGLPMRNVAITVVSPQIMLNESKLSKTGKLTLRILGSATPPRTHLQSLPCTLLANNEKMCDVAVSTFTGNLKELGVKCWPERIANGSLVYITHVFTQSEVCISSISCKGYPELFTNLARKCGAFDAKDEIKTDEIVLASLANCKEFFRAKILSQISNKAFRVLDIDTGGIFEVDRDLLRKPNLFVRSSPVFMNRVKLIYVDKIPTPIEDNKAIVTLQQCKNNGVEFLVRHDPEDPEVVDLLMKTDEQQSLSKQLLPLLFEKSSNGVSGKKSSRPGVSSSVITSPAVDSNSAEETPLPPSPPDTPITKNAPFEMSIPLKTTEDASCDNSSLPLPNLNIEQLQSQASAILYTLEDLEIIGIPNGENVPLTVLDASTIQKGYITACDFSNRESLQLMDTNLDKVKKHGKCPHLQKGYEPKVNEICLTLFKEDDEWYRALCMNILKDGKFLIMFLDFGNMCVVTKNECLPITKDLMFPSNANLCCIEDFPANLTKQQLESFLGNTLKNPIINCKVTKQEDDTYNIKVHNLEKYFA